MPWCDQCRRYWQTQAVTADGGCPECGHVVGDPPSTPWHFKLLVVAVVLYLGWRAWQGVDWLIAHL